MHMNATVFRAYFINVTLAKGNAKGKVHNQVVNNRKVRNPTAKLKRKLKRQQLTGIKTIT